MKKLFLLIPLVSLVFALSCAGGGNSVSTTEAASQQSRLNKIDNEVLALVSLQGELDDIVQSEYATCENEGDLKNDLLRKICAIAQSASAELQTQLLAQIGVLAGNIQLEIDQINATLTNESLALNARIDNVQALISTTDANLAALTVRMTSAESAINAINAFDDDLDIPGSMSMILVGGENLTSGPVFESVVKRKDNTQFRGFVEEWAEGTSIAEDGLSRTAGSRTITITADDGHDFSIGDIVKISGVSQLVTTGTIKTVSLGLGGSGYDVGDVITVGGGGTGGNLTIATVDDTNGEIDTVAAAPTFGGLGYVVGDVLEVTTAGTGGKVTVIATSGGGVVTEVSLTAIGSGYTTGAGKATSYFSGSSAGSGCTVNITAVGGRITSFEAIPATGTGSGYIESDGNSTTAIPAGSGHGATVNIETIVNNNIISSDFNDKLFTVTAIDEEDGTFTIELPVSSTHTDSFFGGDEITATKLIGRQMQQIWASGDPSDTEVRTTTTGSVPYNFIIIRIDDDDPTKAALCYDMYNPDADFETILEDCPEGSVTIYSSYAGHGPV